MDVVIAVIAGLMFGSFLSVLLARLPAEGPAREGWATGRSRCPNCMHTLAWYDLVPVFSWLALRGKCRYCSAPIPRHYLWLELAMASVLGIYVARWGVSSAWQWVDLIMLFGLTSLFFFDLEYHLLPDAFTLGLSAIALARLIGLRPDLLVNAMATAIFLAAGVGLIYLLTHGRAIGFGDVKLAFLIGLLFGYPAAIGVTLLAIWVGALVGVFLLATHRATMKTALPLGSFWTAAAIFTLLFPGPVYWLSGLLTPVL